MNIPERIVYEGMVYVREAQIGKGPARPSRPSRPARAARPTRAKPSRPAKPAKPSTTPSNSEKDRNSRIKQLHLQIDLLAERIKSAKPERVGKMYQQMKRLKDRLRDLETGAQTTPKTPKGYYVPPRRKRPKG